MDPVQLDAEIFQSAYQLVSGLGVSGLLVFAVWYLVRDRQKSEQLRDATTQKREEQLSNRLQSLEDFQRDSMTHLIVESTKTLTESTNVMRSVVAAIDKCARQ